MGSGSRGYRTAPRSLDDIFCFSRTNANLDSALYISARANVYRLSNPLITLFAWKWTHEKIFSITVALYVRIDNG